MLYFEATGLPLYCFQPPYAPQDGAHWQESDVEAGWEDSEMLLNSFELLHEEDAYISSEASVVNTNALEDWTCLEEKAVSSDEGVVVIGNADQWVSDMDETCSDISIESIKASIASIIEGGHDCGATLEALKGLFCDIVTIGMRYVLGGIGHCSNACGSL